MKNTRKLQFRSNRMYNSGKISGLNYFDVQVKFEEADDEIRSLGAKPVNPLNKWLVPESSPWILHMILDILLMLTCKQIYLHKDWEESRGAKIEKKIAEKLGYKIVTQESVVNAREVNAAEDKKKAFRRSFLTSVKLRFERGDERIRQFMQIARSFGVTWTMEERLQPKEASDYFPANGLLYIWESSEGRLHFAHGGSIKYFQGSEEKEISPDLFFEIWNKVDQLNTSTL